MKKGRKWTEEERARRAANRKPVSAETRAKISAANKGVPKTPEQKAKMSAAKKGVPKSLEHRESMRKARAAYEARRKAAKNSE